MQTNMHCNWKEVWRCAAAFGILIVCYLLLGGIAYMMPDGAVKRNAKTSVDHYDFQTDYPLAIIPRTRCMMDNYTDALIVNQAAHLREIGPKGILLLPRYFEQNDGQTRNLRNSFDPDGIGHIEIYPRYWHGSTFITRIMLTFSHYTSIRYILYLFTSALMLWLMLALWKRVGKVAMAVVGFSLLMVNVFVMQFSMQFAQVLIIAIGGMLWLCYHQEGAVHRPWVLFFVLGSLTTFLDLITVPTITLGLPIVVYLSLYNEPKMSKGLGRVILIAGVWLLGYVLTWLAKWSIGTLLTDVNVFQNAITQGKGWSNHGYEHITGAFLYNIAHLRCRYILVVVVALAGLAAAFYNKKGWTKAIPMALVVFIPFVYYILMARPAEQHNFFNYRALVTSIAAGLMAIASMVDWHRAKGWVTELCKHNTRKDGTASK